MVGNSFLVTFSFTPSPLFFIDPELVCVGAGNIDKKKTYCFGNVDLGGAFISI